ncbi:MAG TPA: hypothetical protein DIW61_03060 [Candidatus Aminicenantes bacterium]|nr:hypothetical protein [Candidatus Aminicenantes bacterium]
MGIINCQEIRCQIELKWKDVDSGAPEVDDDGPLEIAQCLSFVADRPSPLQAAYQEVLMAAEAGSEYSL